MKTMQRDEIGPYLKALNVAFEQEIGRLNFKKKVREDLVAGFADGTRSVLLALERDGYLDVNRADAPGAATPTDDADVHTGGAVGASMIADDEPEAAMRVVDKGGRMLHAGDEVTSFRGDKARFVRATRRDPGGGKVLIEAGNGSGQREMNASVYGLEVR